MQFFKKKTTVDENIRTRVVTLLYPIIDEYVDWYCEHGIYLPKSYELDPTGWTEVLRQIQRAFFLIYTSDQEDGEMTVAIKQNDEAYIKKLNEEINSGFFLFGKHLADLNDRYGSRK